MEWLGLLLLYLISGYMKKRQQNQKRKKIEGDPDWDSETNFHENKQSNDLDILLNDLFESNPETPEPNPARSDKLIIETDNADKDTIFEENSDLNVNISDKIEKDLTKIDEQVERFEKNIYHSELAEKKELHFGNKWLKEKNLRKYLFKSKNTLKKSIIVKEILDRPLSLRK